MKRYADGTEYKPRKSLTDIEDEPAPLPMTRKQARELLTAASALLDKLDYMTTTQFSCGLERTEREALRAVIAKIGGAK